MILKQSKLDIEKRSRRSRLPWRGQFSPEFIEYILQSLLNESKVIYDPFCGSGTVLFEATAVGKMAVGSDVNPAAWCLASLACFTALSTASKEELLVKLQGALLSGRPADTVLRGATSKSNSEFTRLAFSCAVLLGMKNSEEFDNPKAIAGLSSVLSVLANIYNNAGHAQCSIEDARYSSLKSSSVDAIVTSPPYINVFNYHQNYRPAIELLGWKPLDAAKSEIGANRKFRQNRFLTVVQYSIDMALAMNDMIRVCRSEAPIILVVGRSSNVLGTPFENSKIVRRLASATNSLIESTKLERSFTNKFGLTIVEDILVFKVVSKKNKYIPIPDARQIGIEILREVSSVTREKQLISEAIEKSGDVEQSQELHISIPLLG